MVCMRSHLYSTNSKIFQGINLIMTFGKKKLKSAILCLIEVDNYILTRIDSCYCPKKKSSCLHLFWRTLINFLKIKKEKKSDGEVYQTQTQQTLKIKHSLLT